MAKKLRAIAAVAVAVVLFGLTGESLMRIIYLEEEANGNYWGIGAFEPFELTGYRSKPGFEGRVYRSGDFDVSMRIFDHGLRQSDLFSQMSYEKKILFVGSSYTFGLGVEEREAFPARLAEVLNPLGVGVINGSQTGYGITQMVDFGIHPTEIVDPTAILLVLTFASYRENDYQRSYENIGVVDGYRLAKDRWLAGTGVDYLRTHSYLWMRVNFLSSQSRLRARLNRLWRRIVGDESQSGEPVPLVELARPGLDALEKLKRHCEDNGITLGVILLTRRVTPLRLASHLRGRFESSGVPVLKVGVSESHSFPTDGHWNAEGHRIVAERIGPFAIDLVGSN